MQRVYLIRHTSVDLNGRYFYGRTDVPLASSFPEEAARIRTLLPEALDFPFWSSPLSRCRFLAERLEVPFETDERLLELNFGHWEMKPFEEIPKDERDHYLANFTRQSPPNGEGFTALQKRAVEFLEEIVDLEHETVGIVAHSGVIRSMLCHVMGLPLENTYRFGLDYGSVSTLVKDWRGLRVDQINL